MKTKESDKAESCEKCRSHHKAKYDDDYYTDWYCGVYHKWDCSKSLLHRRDYSHKKKGAK